MYPPGHAEYESWHRERLLDHARTHADALKESGVVVGLILGGSVAHGGADRESDEDIVAVVSKLPSLEERAAWLSRITGRQVDPVTLGPTEKREWDEYHLPRDDPEQWMGTGGGLLYVTHEETVWAVAHVADLLVGDIGEATTPHPAHLDECLPDLAHGIILHDPMGTLAEWQRQLASYPETARVRLVNFHWHQAEIAISEDLPRAVWRSDHLHAYDRRVEGVRHLVRLLFAMNRRYFRTAKGLDRLFPTFPQCPREAWPRLVAALGEPDHLRAAAMLLALAGDIIDLIEPPGILERREHWRELCAHWAQEYGVS